MIRWTLGFFACLVSFLFISATHAEVYVADKLGHISPAQNVHIPAGVVKAFPISTKEFPDAEHVIDFTPLKAMFFDTLVMVCNDLQKQIIISGGRGACKSYSIKDRANIKIKTVAGTQYWLIFDNRSSLISTKSFSYTIHSSVKVVKESRKKMRESLNAGMQEFFDTIETPEFDLRILSCGQKNAFSDIDDGDITLCSELLFYTEYNDLKGAFAGIFAHELGHTLMNLWGDPNFKNERSADEFAIALTFILENVPTSSSSTQPDLTAEDVLRDTISFFENIANTSLETQAAMVGGQHPLSVQRINNFKQIMKAPDEFVKQWTGTIYPRLKVRALESIIDDPHTGADVDLAKKLLLKRKACGTIPLNECQFKAQ